MTNEEPKEARFSYQKQENPGLICEKCGRSSELLYGIHEPTQIEPGRILKVCAFCLNKHQQKGGDLAPSSAATPKLAGGNE